MQIPRVLLAAGASGSGKTLVTCGILEALVERGLKVASFKCGPDYIDPMFHSRVIGTRSANLDTFFTSDERTRYLLACNASGCDVAVMEGVMGYYDGVGGTSVKASAYDLAQTTDTPVILIVNSKGMSVSLAAYIKGFLEYKKDSHIRGVIFNQMSPMLYPRMKKMVEEELGIGVYGYVPVVEECRIESRHLGLVLPDEVEDLKGRLCALAKILEDTLDLDGILALAAQAASVSDSDCSYGLKGAFAYHTERPVRIGVAEDDAFCFFYRDNFRLLTQMGAELVPFSPLSDPHLPADLDGLLLYGGYPELHGAELEANESMRSEIRAAIESGMPCLAECGGFMYLHEQMEDIDGVLRTTAGVIPGKAFRTKRLTRFGYVTLLMAEETGAVLGEKDLGEIPAHEFHYYDSENNGDAFLASKPLGSRSWKCIHAGSRVMAGFPHLHYYGNPSVPKAFLKTCLNYQEEKMQRSNS